MHVKNHQHFHFMGIAGIGMSAIALVLKKRGFTVSGCDLNITTSNCKTLSDLGCALFKGHSSHGCSDKSITTVIYTTMIDPHHPELIAARSEGITCLHRSEILGLLTKSNTTIAIAGSHGKTTTSALISHLFITADKDPSVIIGGNLSTIKGNAYNGSSDTLIIEADESDRSFLNLSPTYEIITNIDFEHLETYKDIIDVQNTFHAFMKKVPSNGAIIACHDEPYIRELLPQLSCPIITYGYHPEATWRIVDDSLDANSSTFSLVHNNNKKYTSIVTSLAGKHNILNSTAAWAMGYHYRLTEFELRKGLATFPGVERRFTYKGITKTHAQVFDDYGHHPKEIAATLQVAYNKPHNRLVVIFQPHRYSRTAGLWNDFLELFAHSSIDELIITDLHSAYETPIENINSEKFVTELKIKNPLLSVSYIPLESDFHSLATKISDCTQENDLILLQGAGKITDLADKIVM